MVQKGISMLNVDGRKVEIMPGNVHCPAEYVEHKRYSIGSEQINYHGIPTAELPAPTAQIKEVILALVKGGYGWHEVELLVNPHMARVSLYNSHYDLGANTPLPTQEEKARAKYGGVERVLEQGNFKVHVFSNETIGFEELTK